MVILAGTADLVVVGLPVAGLAVAGLAEFWAPPYGLIPACFCIRMVVLVDAVIGDSV